MRNDPLTVSDLIDLVEETFDSWMHLLESVPGNKWEKAGVSGDWSLKDVIAHITWHEEQMVTVMEARALVGSEWWELPTHERNAKIYAANKFVPLQDVLNNAASVHRQLVAQIGALNDSDLNEPGQFAGMPDNWLLGDILAENTYLHYGDHAASVAKWISAQELP